MTYKHCVFQPGPRINLVIGPNGVGKSSILCAVVLGLGGAPRLLGRQKDLAQFVRRVDSVGAASDRATIRITLKADPNDAAFSQDPIIERSFGRGGNQSKWKINHKNSTEKQVREIVRETFGIRLDNLCMFLPQDIVGNFSNYTSQQILRETQLAILGEESVEEQERLQKLVEDDKHRDHKRKGRYTYILPHSILFFGILYLCFLVREVQKSLKTVNRQGKKTTPPYVESTICDTHTC
jgi:structural maintenance of chromosomes protein 5